VSHQQDLDAHELTALRERVRRLESILGLWTVRATDSFTGTDGALTKTSTGNLSWTTISSNALHRIGGRCRSPDGSLRGATLDMASANGQVQAELDPGNGEASLFVRWKLNGESLMVQRTGDGISLIRFEGGASNNLVPPVLVPHVPGEVIKVRFVLSSLEVLRRVGGVDSSIMALDYPALLTETRIGVRLSGTGTADSLRVLSWEQI
jgi:hypothetical protein